MNSVVHPPSRFVRTLIAEAIGSKSTSYRKLAAEIGCDHAYLNNIVKGRQAAPRSTGFYDGLGSALGIAPEEIVEYRRLVLVAAMTDEHGGATGVVDELWTASSASRSGRKEELRAPVPAGLVIDEESFQALIDGEPLDLTYTEYELLRHLVASPGRVFTREVLLDQVWGYGYYGGERTVDVHIRRLRAKLGGRHQSSIETVRNVGYRFTSL